MNTLPPILIVDDAREDALLLNRLLSRAGVKHNLMTFHDPRNACAFLAEQVQGGEMAQVPALIFTDLQMPPMDGCAFARWVRRNVSKAVPIVMATGSANPDDPERAIEAGVNEVLTKFPTVARLLEVTRKFGCVIDESSTKA
jgi:CheY-like chemotaxis protein